MSLDAGHDVARQVYVYGMSRSGTTLLTTVLDAHPDISMGYELLTKVIDDAADAADRIEATGTEDPRACSARLEESGDDRLGVVVHRADRALVGPAELVGILRGLSAEGCNDLSTLPGRVRFASSVVGLKARKEGNQVVGFKLNLSRIGRFDRLVGGGARYVLILRDPRDVWSSHRERGFDRTAEQVARTWRARLGSFEAFARRHPDRTHLVRYEDLVCDPRGSLDSLCSALGISHDPAMDRFYDSGASVLRGGHANSEALARDFFTTSLGRWRDDTDEADLRTLEAICHEGMTAHGYARTTDTGFRFGDREWAAYRERMDARHRFYLDEYAALVLPAVAQYPHRTWAEATCSPPIHPTRLLRLRRPGGPRASIGPVVTCC